MKCILLDPYANAFYKDFNKVSEWKERHANETWHSRRKWRLIASAILCDYSYGYWKQTGDTSVFDSNWKEAMETDPSDFHQNNKE